MSRWLSFGRLQKRWMSERYLRYVLILPIHACNVLGTSHDILDNDVVFNVKNGMH